MLEIKSQEWSIVTNLQDAGCDKALIQQCVTLLKEGKPDAAAALLAKHRRHLLDCYHADQKKISCLDYFLYQLKQQERRK